MYFLINSNEIRRVIFTAFYKKKKVIPFLYYYFKYFLFICIYQLNPNKKDGLCLLFLKRSYLLFLFLFFLKPLKKIVIFIFKYYFLYIIYFNQINK